MLCVTASADQSKHCSVVSCLCDASLPYPPSQQKIPAVPVISLCWHYLLGVSADAWQNDIPDSSAAPVDNSPACLIKKEIPNHIPLMPLAVTPVIFFPAREALVQIPVVVQRTGGKKAEGKCFISLVEWVNAKEASKLKPRRSNMRGAPVELNQQLWNTFMNSRFFSISSRFLNAMTSLLVPQRGKKKWMCPKRQQAEAGGCSEMAQKIVLTVAWVDASPSAHSQKDVAIYIRSGVISGADTRLVSLINNNSSCLAVATGQDWWGDFDQSRLLSWEDSTPCARRFCQPASLSALVDMLARGRGFEMEQEGLTGAMPLVSWFLSWSSVF